MNQITFAQAVKAAVLCLRAENYIGAEAAVNSAKRLAARDTQEWVADDLLKAVQAQDINKSQCLWYLDKPVTSTIGLDMELALWDRAAEDERTLWSDMRADYGFYPSDFNWQYQSYPTYLIAHKYPTVEAGWEWPFYNYASTEEFREAIRQQDREFPF